MNFELKFYYPNIVNDQSKKEKICEIENESEIESSSKLMQNKAQISQLVTKTKDEQMKGYKDFNQLQAEMKQRDKELKKRRRNDKKMKKSNSASSNNNSNNNSIIVKEGINSSSSEKDATLPKVTQSMVPESKGNHVQKTINKCAISRYNFEL